MNSCMKRWGSYLYLKWLTICISIGLVGFSIYYMLSGVFLKYKVVLVNPCSLACEFHIFFFITKQQQMFRFEVHYMLFHLILTIGPLDRAIRYPSYCLFLIRVFHSLVWHWLGNGLRSLCLHCIFLLIHPVQELYHYSLHLAGLIPDKY